MLWHIASYACEVISGTDSYLATSLQYVTVCAKTSHIFIQTEIYLLPQLIVTLINYA